MRYRKATLNELEFSSLCGHVNATYAQLKKAFGEQHCDGDGYKTDAEWMLGFEDGTVAAVYNWKNGVNYMGEQGIAVEHIKQWNVGGFSKDAVRRVKAELDAVFA